MRLGKKSSDLEPGYVYAPYIPLQTSSQGIYGDDAKRTIRKNKSAIETRSKTNKTIRPFGCVLDFYILDIFLDKQKLKVFGDVFDDNIFNPRICKEKLNTN